MNVVVEINSPRQQGNFGMATGIGVPAESILPKDQVSLGNNEGLMY